MKILNKVLFILIILFSISSANAQFSVGIFGGVNISDFFEDETPDGSPVAAYENHFGIGTGILAEYKFADLGVSIQPMYVQKGMIASYGSIYSGEPRDSIEITINYFSVPVLFKVYAATDIMYVSGGIDIGYKLDATYRDINANTETDISDSFKDFNIAALLGVGAQFSLGHFYIFVEGRYSQSISNISDSNPDDPNVTNSTFRMTAFQLFAGLTYSFGGGKNE